MTHAVLLFLGAAGISVPEEFRGEHLLDYVYDEKVVFRVLDRYAPAIDTLIASAIETKALLHLADEAIIYFKSRSQIQSNFSVRPKRHAKGHLVIDPNNVRIGSIRTGNKSTYYLGFSDQASDFSISKSTYHAVSVAKSAAIAGNKLLKFNLRSLCDDSYSSEDTVSLVKPKLRPDEHCIICLEKKKNIMCSPCNHVCLCEDCEATIEENCPICQSKFESKKKIYL